MNIDLLQFVPRAPNGCRKRIAFTNCPCGKGLWWAAWFADETIASPHGEGPSKKAALTDLLEDAI